MFPRRRRAQGGAIFFLIPLLYDLPMTCLGVLSCLDSAISPFPLSNDYGVAPGQVQHEGLVGDPVLHILSGNLGRARGSKKTMAGNKRGTERCKHESLQNNFRHGGHVKNWRIDMGKPDRKLPLQMMLSEATTIAYALLPIHRRIV